jgi:3-deoxy-D-manno-octulosonic acid kinase
MRDAGRESFVAESDDGVVASVHAELADGARALGLLARGGIARAFAAGVPLAGGRAAACVLALPRNSRAGGWARTEVVVRRLRHGGLLAPLLGELYFGPARVLAELEATRALFAAGAPVPEPALALAQRRTGPLWECAFGTLRVPGETLLATLLRAPDEGERADALRACAEAVRAFHDAGGRHADLNATNLIVARGAQGARAQLVDLDRATIAAPVPARRRAREIARLWRSLEKHARAKRVVAQEREAFVAAYGGGDAELQRALRGWLRAERVRTALHGWRYARR